ncbi:ABC transporter substrate-binding protein [Nibricoccus sp. IMCC34717]|uniref:ABC transporter substrate-binding protein n=1 Tax=Nibricoccus sp. IMCC34717 TaxID=3034021 RepID=UPI0038503AE8
MDLLITVRRVVAAGVCALAATVCWGATANRVVSQTVGTDEILLAIADADEVAALSHLATNREFSAVAEQAAGFPRLQANADAEGILAHRPSLVLFADYSRIDLRTQVHRSGVRILVFDRYATLQDTYDNLRLLARDMGPHASEKAERVIAETERRVGMLKLRLAGVRPTRVIAPSTYGLLPGDDTTFQDICDHAGAENLGTTLGHLTGHAPQPTEEMLEWPIETVVVAGENAEAALKPLREVAPYRYLDAVKQGRAAVIAPWHMSCVSHLRVDAYEQLARALHPERFQ